MAIEGPLKELHIHDVFQLLDLGRKTGVLRITSDLRNNSGTVYFEDGAVVGAEIESNPHKLGGLLLRSGKVSEEDLVRARTLQSSRPERLGELLVEIGAVSRRVLDRHIRAQVEEVIFELMSWSEGYFRFDEGDPGQTTAEATFRIAPESLLMEAARRIDEWSRIETKIPHLDVIPSLDPDQADSAAALDLVPFEWELLAAVDGSASARRLAAHVGSSEFDVAKTLFGLASAGIIVLKDGARHASGRAEGVGMFADQVDEQLESGDTAGAYLSAQDAVLACPHDADAYLLLGRGAMANGRPEEGLEAIERAFSMAGDSARGARLLGLALAGLGRFDEAQAAWGRWKAYKGKDSSELAWEATIDRLVNAARVLDNAVRGGGRGRGSP